MTVKAFCSDNTTRLLFSGGFQVVNVMVTTPSLTVYGSYSNQTDRSWNVIIHNTDDHPIFIQPEAICVHENPYVYEAKWVQIISRQEPDEIIQCSSHGVHLYSSMNSITNDDTGLLNL